jgi:hypothetical protein
MPKKCVPFCRKTKFMWKNIENKERKKYKRQDIKVENQAINKYRKQGRNGKRIEKVKV